MAAYVYSSLSPFNTSLRYLTNACLTARTTTPSKNQEEDARSAATPFSVMVAKSLSTMSVAARIPMVHYRGMLETYWILRL